MGSINLEQLPDHVETLEGLQGVMLEALGSFNRSITLSLYDNLMITTPSINAGHPFPERTNTLKKNWRVAPGNTGDSSFLPRSTKVRVVDRARPTKVFNYLGEAKKITIFNNSPYVNYVNNGIRGNDANSHFIQKALKMTEDKYQ